jgi:hypothetical protein
MSDLDDKPDDAPQYVSPKRCLARSFRLSRDRWKAKATERLRQIKALKVKARDLAVSRHLWKAKALHLQAQLAQLLGDVPPPDQAPALDHTDQAAQPPPGPTPTAPALHPHAPEVVPPKKARRARR